MKIPVNQLPDSNQDLDDYALNILIFIQILRENIAVHSKTTI